MFTYIVPCIAVVVTAFVLARLYNWFCTDLPRVGDAVLYVPPNCFERNMITMVLHVFPIKGTAVIRHERTTSVVSLRNLQVLRLNQSGLLAVPEEPQADVSVPDTGWQLKTVRVLVGQRVPERGHRCSQNVAGFRNIPRNWLGYGIAEHEGILTTSEQ